MTDLLTMMATPAWAYLAIFGFLTIDAMIPVVPLQAIMITAGALTVYGNLDLPLVIGVGALGMFAGDSIAFLLGHSAGQAGNHWLSNRLAAIRSRFGPRHDDGPHEASRTKKAAERFTRGLRRPGPLVLLLCRFVPGGRMAAGYAAGRGGYPIKLFIAYDGGAAVAWATYGGLVGHIGGTAITQSAWRLFAIAAAAAVIFGTAGWILALFGGRKDVTANLTLDAGEVLAASEGHTAGIVQPGTQPSAGTPDSSASDSSDPDSPAQDSRVDDLRDGWDEPEAGGAPGERPARLRH